MSPAKSIRDGDLLARMCLALGATSVRPAVASRLGSVDAALDLALDGPAYDSRAWKVH